MIPLLMPKKEQARRKKIDWLRAALAAFEANGIEGVRVERLAQTLNVAKSGFYWHFKDRAQLYDELLEFWEEESTEVVTSSAELAALEPAERLLQAAHLIFEKDLGRLDLPFWAWARGCPKVRERVRRVYDVRFSWIRESFRELGFKGADLEMRVRLFLVYHSWEGLVFKERSAAQAKRLIKLRVEFLTRP
jgi:AcrR family transcriptional regulator